MSGTLQSHVIVSNLLPDEFVERQVLESRVQSALEGLGTGPWFVTLRPAIVQAGPRSVSIEVRNGKGPVSFAIAQPDDAAKVIASRLSLFRLPQ
jgi:hypothetical protein